MGILKKMEEVKMEICWEGDVGVGKQPKKVDFLELGLWKAFQRQIEEL